MRKTGGEGEVTRAEVTVIYSELPARGSKGKRQETLPGTYKPYTLTHTGVFLSNLDFIFALFL